MALFVILGSCLCQRCIYDLHDCPANSTRNCFLLGSHHYRTHFQTFTSTMVDLIYYMKRCQATFPSVAICTNFSIDIFFLSLCYREVPSNVPSTDVRTDLSLHSFKLSLYRGQCRAMFHPATSAINIYFLTLSWRCYAIIAFIF